MKRILRFASRYLRALVYTVYAFTAGLFSVRHRELIDTVIAHAKRVNQPAVPPISTPIPQVELAEIVPEDVMIQIREPMAVNGNVSLLEVMTIARLVQWRCPKRLFEIGTFDGRTTLNMAANCPSDAQVYTLDLPASGLNATALPVEHDDKAYIAKEMSGARLQGKDCARKITQLYGDSATFDFSPFVGSMDFVFVDGAHSYEYAASDSKQAIRLLRNGTGIIVWHDYGTPYWPGVTRALNELYMNAGEFREMKHIRGTAIVCLMAGGNSNREIPVQA